MNKNMSKCPWRNCKHNIHGGCNLNIQRIEEVTEVMVNCPHCNKDHRADVELLICRDYEERRD